MISVGLPLFLVVAMGVERVADLLVHGFRAIAAPETAEDGKEVR